MPNGTVQLNSPIIFNMVDVFLYS